MWIYGNLAERNAVLLVMSPFYVPIACAQVNIDKSLLSTDNTARVREYRLQTGPWVTHGLDRKPSICGFTQGLSRVAQYSEVR